MSFEQLISPKTGHPAIDHQHQHLESLILKFSQLCLEPQTESCPKPGCTAEARHECMVTLDSLIGDLLCFLIDHFHYEEQLMRLLPDTPICRKHVEAHTFAHAELSARLSELTMQLDKENPYECARRLQDILTSWMGGHAEAFDIALANSLEEASNAELHYDIDLVELIKNAPSRPGGIALHH